MGPDRQRQELISIKMMRLLTPEFKRFLKFFDNLRNILRFTHVIPPLLRAVSLVKERWTLRFGFPETLVR